MNQGPCQDRADPGGGGASAHAASSAAGRRACNGAVGFKDPISVQDEWRGRSRLGELAQTMG